MPSPFPGMDPYLEQHWADVHTALIGYIRDELQPQLAEDLIARMEEKVYVEDENETLLRGPDVRVAELPVDWQAQQGSTSTAVLDEPLLLQPIGDPIRQKSVLIYDSAGHRIITAIEILSPWNKTPGKAVDEYLEKRKKYAGGKVNLIEIDLIRTGDWTKMIGSYVIPDHALTAYRVSIIEPGTPTVGLYPISLNSKLPTIKVPLRSQDTPARLNLQLLIEKAYTMGRYNRIDYTKPCKPPFQGAEIDWAEAVFQRAGER
jgi:hypothetical protein